MTSRPSRAESLQALCDEGLKLEFSGRREDARRCYQRVLQRDPAHFNALCLLSGLCAQSGQGELAVSLIRRALRGAPSGPMAAVALAAAHSNLGNVLTALGRHDEALASHDKAVALQPRNAQCHVNRGAVLFQLGRTRDALASFETALALDGRDAAALFSRGAALDALGRSAEALASYDRAIALRPDHAPAWVNRGLSLFKLGRVADALESYDRAMALQPGLIEAHANRTTALQQLDRQAEALASADTVIALDPNHAEAHVDRGSALHILNRPEESLVSYDRAVALDPRDALAQFGRAATLATLDRHAEALRGFEAAIAVRPDYDEARFQRSLMLLSMGRFAEGWREYEWRRSRIAAPDPRKDPTRLWLGEVDLSGRTLFVHHEQGLGDTIQFCRFIPIVRRRAGAVVVSVQTSLRRLISQIDPTCDYLDGTEVPAEYDFHCPLLSLPLALAIDLPTIPSAPRYLAADPERRARFEAWLGPRRGPRVGIAWSGSPGHDNDRNRSLAFAALAPLLACGADWICLHKEIRPSDLDRFFEAGGVRFAGGMLADFSDTAGLIETLDLVISVDTSVAHLAAALGKPTWILLPYGADWRWMSGRSDSPWYPTARLVRQVSPGDWPGAIDQVRRDLEAWLQAGGPDRPRPI